MAKDFFHDLVKRALEKDGWLITHDQFELPIEKGLKYEIDFGAEKIITAEKGIQKIAVEVKSFLSASEAYDFHGALGQYMVYKEALNKTEPDRKLYLALPQKVKKGLLKFSFIQTLLTKFGINIFIFDPNKGEITEWKN